MILGHHGIIGAVNRGDITINPFIPAEVGPNSYDLHLADKLMVYNAQVLDIRRELATTTYDITDGQLLLPGELYLGHTVERTGTDKYVPMIEGRSSLARLGISIHVSAGFGDVGFSGQWTLEITAVKPVWIYPGIRVCQIFFYEVTDAGKLYRGKYQNSQGVNASRMHRDLE